MAENTVSNEIKCIGSFSPLLLSWPYSTGGGQGIATLLDMTPIWKSIVHQHINQHIQVFEAI